MFRELLAHPQEALHNTTLAILRACCAVPPEDEQVMVETCRGP
jgi:hypothetical protein